MTSCITGRPGDRVLAVDIGACSSSAVLPITGMRHEGAWRVRQAGHLGHRLHDAVELVGCGSPPSARRSCVSSVMAWVATAGAQVLQWPTPTMAASPLALISSQVLGSSCW